jgi:hypothetical protein
MTGPRVIAPVVGDWYEGRDGIFEVVAADEADGTIEIQYHDGSLEELELADWMMRCKAGTLTSTEQPEDYTGAIDVEPVDDTPSAAASFDMEGALNAGALDDVGLFD